MTEHTDAEKAAEEWANEGCHRWYRERARLTGGQIMSALDAGEYVSFLAGAAWAAPKWIKCSERLPEEERDVVLYGSRGIFFGWRSSTESGSPKFYNFDSEIYGVTHWMPLPAAPKEEK